MDINSGHFGTLQSISSFVRILSDSVSISESDDLLEAEGLIIFHITQQAGKLVTKLGARESAFFTLREVSGGVL